jgi:hypothetical protein
MPTNNGETGILFESADMKIIETLLLGCIIIAVIQWVIILLYVTFVMIVLWAVLFRSREAFGLLILCLCANLIQAHPLVCVAGIVLLLLAHMAHEKRDERSIGGPENAPGGESLVQ